MEIFVPSSYIHIISSTVTIVSIFSTVVSIVTITIITVYSNNIWHLLSAHFLPSTVLTILQFYIM